MLEIGTWSNEMAENVDNMMDEDDEMWGLPPNVNMCSRRNTNIRYGSPTSWDVDKKRQQMNLEHYYTDSEGKFGTPVFTS